MIVNVPNVGRAHSQSWGNHVANGMIVIVPNLGLVQQFPVVSRETAAEPRSDDITDEHWMKRPNKTIIVLDRELLWRSTFSELLVLRIIVWHTLVGGSDLNQSLCDRAFATPPSVHGP